MTRSWCEILISRARGAAPALLIAGLMTAMPPASASPVLAAACAVPAVAGAHGLDSAKASGSGAGGGSNAIEVEGGTASPVASPPVVTAAPVDPARTLDGDLTAVAEALAACLSAGDAKMVTALAGERYLGQLFGSSVPMSSQEYESIAEELTPVPTRIIDLEEVTPVDSSHATALVTHVVGNQLMESEWTFEQAPQGDRTAGQSPWRVAGERQLPAEPPRGAVAIAVTIDDNAFTLDRPEVKGPDVVLRGENDDSIDHEMLVVRLAEGYTTDDLLRASGPDLPQEVTYVGEIPVRAGASRDLVLVGLKPGVYTLICLFTDSDGVPYLAYGMSAEFRVK
ncbi:MAG: hypothetical protein U0031_15275 [Thermomicrobiales bacterium]